VGNGVLGSSKVGQRNSQVVVRFCRVGLETECLGIMCHGLLHPPLARQGNRQIVMSIGKIPPEPNGFAIMTNGLF